MAHLAAKTLPDIFDRRVAATPHGEAYRQFDAATNQWRTLTWQQVDGLVSQWRQALLAQALPPGARVGILVPNGLDHVCMDQAALSLGLVPVPMHAVDNPGSIAYILQDSDASLLLLDTLTRWHGIAAVGTPLPGLQRVVVLDTNTVPAADAALVSSLADWLSQGAAVPASTPRPVVAPEALAAIVYTSGTTGRPKGVMLSHRNVVSNITSVLGNFEVQADDLLLSFLPLSHTFERTIGYYLPIAVGACVAFARSIPLLQEDLRTVRPTVLVSVPRIYERIFAKVQETSREGSPLSRQLLHWAETIGWQRFQAEQGRGTFGLAQRLAWRFLQPLVAQRVLDVFGGRLRIAVAGGAPLGGSVAHFFLGLGLNILQGYGMTETSPVVSCNTLRNNEPSSIGPALPGVQVRIAETGELMVAGPAVMVGYWKRPEDTQRVLEADGWLHTGDQAKIVDGRLYIVGRIKDIIVTSTGEKVPPSDLELAIQADPLFSQVLVVGEQRPFLSVLAVVNEPTWLAAAAESGFDPKQAGILSSPQVQQWALARIAQQTRSFPSYAMPKRVWLTTEPWTIDDGLMTPTLKLKRPALEGRFASQIADLYQKR